MVMGKKFISNAKAWKFALEGIKPEQAVRSAEFWELVEREKRGEITTGDMRRRLDGKYRESGGEVFEQVKAELAAIRLREMAQNPLPGDGDLGHLRAVYEYLYQDFSPWAYPQYALYDNIFRAIGAAVGISQWRELLGHPRVKTLPVGWGV
jgi:hypothetical protein